MRRWIMHERLISNYLEELDALEEHAGVCVEEANGDPFQKQVHLGNSLVAVARIRQLQSL